LNPADNELFATMIGNFNDGSAAGKIQWGSAWWFLDQKDGMIKQINALSNMGLLSNLSVCLLTVAVFFHFQDMNISGDYFAIYLVKKLKTVNFPTI
jgi:glucuronate isomerase